MSIFLPIFCPLFIFFFHSRFSSLLQQWNIHPRKKQQLKKGITFYCTFLPASLFLGFTTRQTIILLSFVIFNQASLPVNPSQPPAIYPDMCDHLEQQIVGGGKKNKTNSTCGKCGNGRTPGFCAYAGFVTVLFKFSCFLNHCKNKSDEPTQLIKYLYISWIKELHIKFTEQ